jgi:hypothetical protein
MQQSVLPSVFPVVGAFTNVVGSFPPDVDFVEITDRRLRHE